MRWKHCDDLSPSPKPGDRELFLRRPRWIPRFLDCGCVVVSRPYIETFKYGFSALDEIKAGMSIRPHRWSRKTICIRCMQRAAEGDLKDLGEFLVHEEESGAVFHGDILGAVEFDS